MVEAAAQRGKEGAILVTQEQSHLPTVSGQPAGVPGAAQRPLTEAWLEVRAEARACSTLGACV